MNLAQLEAAHKQLYRFIKQERRMRERVLRGSNRDHKLADCDLALENLITLKDALKRHIQQAQHQPKLLDHGERPRYE